MIRIVPGLEDTAHRARFLHGCTLAVVGEYREYIFGRRAKRPADNAVILAVFGRMEGLNSFRKELLSQEGSELLGDGSIRMPDGVTFSFHASFEASGYPAAYDTIDRTDYVRVLPVNERLHVFFDGVWQGQIFHNSYSDWAGVQKHVEDLWRTKAKTSHVTIRATGDPKDDVLAEWGETAPAPGPPPSVTYAAIKNHGPGVKFESPSTDANELLAHAARVADAEPGDSLTARRQFDNAVAAFTTGYKDVVRYTVRVRGTISHHLLQPGENPNPRLAELAGAKDGDMVSFARPGGKAASFIYQKPVPDVEYEGNVNYCLASVKTFLASPTDEADVKAKALAALGASGIVVVRSKKGDSRVYSAAYWTRVN